MRSKEEIYSGKDQQNSQIKRGPMFGNTKIASRDNTFFNARYSLGTGQSQRTSTYPNSKNSNEINMINSQYFLSEFLEMNQSLV